MRSVSWWLVALSLTMGLLPSCGGSDDPCGNGALEAGEQCDLGSANSNSPNAACRLDCKPKRCGDAVVDTGETCDDGNNRDGDGCARTCLSNEACGDGIINSASGEECDDTSASCVACQWAATWEQVTLAVSPMAQTGHALTTSAAGVLLTTSVGADAGQTWRFANAAWMRLNSGAPPSIAPTRSFAALAYDKQRERVVLFGGLSSEQNATSETWLWNGTSWTLVSTPAPPARAHHALTYVASSGLVLLFGGQGVTGAFSDTWLWNGATSTWAEAATSTVPTARWGHSMAYDAARDEVVMVSGQTANGPLGDTWLWDGTWSQVLVGGPSARHGAGMAFDAQRSKVVLFGGIAANAALLDDTWEWNGDAWQAQHAIGSPSARAAPLAFDPTTARIVLIGGGAVATETWSCATDSQ